MTDPTQTEAALILAVTRNPREQTPRDMLRDELIAAGRWAWEVVYPLVCGDPAADGLRLLAADYLNVSDPEPCRKCGGTGIETRPELGMLGRPLSKQCPDCWGLKHDARLRRARGVFVRASVELSWEVPVGAITQEIRSDGGGYSGVAVERIFLGHRWGPRYPELQERIQATQDAARRDADEYPFAHPTEHVRGFIGRVMMSWQNWAEQAPVLRAAYPITDVGLTTWPQDVIPEGAPPRDVVVAIYKDWFAAKYPGVAFTLPPAVDWATGGVVHDEWSDIETDDVPNEWWGGANFNG